jgi:cephalosporin-C deacetylase-like acetyl esterase
MPMHAPRSLALVFCAIGLGVVALSAARPQTAEEWIAFLPGCEDWNQKLRSGALPLVDPETLPGTPWLPDPLRFADGRPVANAVAWPARRRELLELFQHYTMGKMPPSSAARVVEASELSRDGIRHRRVTLGFGSDTRARLRLELFVPSGQGPFPVFLTQANHRAWALVAASRGYIGCVYAGADVLDDTPGLAALWPDSDASLLTRRAWAGSRCVDYLLTLPEVRSDQIAIAGHSRNGKQSLIAGAFDERIAAVISSSSGAGGSIPARLGVERNFAEDIESGTRRYPQWFHPRLRFFAGRENRLPVDQHELIACLAPRPCLLSTGLNDGVESVWAIEHTWREVRRVYALFDRAEAVQLAYRAGGHETNAEDIERYVDWLDGVFGRGPALAPSRPIYPIYADWQRVSGESVDISKFPPPLSSELLRLDDGRIAANAVEWNEKKPAIRARMATLLGEPIPTGPGQAGAYGAEKDHWQAMLNRDYTPPDVERLSLSFGNYIPGELFRPKSAAVAGASARKMPAIIWLQAHSVPFGYVPAQGSLGRRFHFEWAQAGFAVFAFDQIGQGRRLTEVQRFYERHPHASLLGRTVQDVRAAVDALRQQDFVDPDRIYVLGYANGGMAALHAAALDERIAGVIAVAGFTPMRTDTAGKGTGGIARWSHWLPLLPRLGAFIGHEEKIPYDYDEVLALVAPRPIVLIQPTVDYHSTAVDVRACVAEARKVFALHGRAAALCYTEVDDYNRYGRKAADEVLRQLRALNLP